MLTQISLSIAVAALCLVLIATSSHHIKYTHKKLKSVQDVHSTRTPRVGGLALVIALVIWVTVLNKESFGLPKAVVIASLSAFFVGLLEDFVTDLSKIVRIVTPIIGAIVGAELIGVRVDSVAVPALDLVLAIYPVSLAFTGFAVGGMAHAVNMLDGLNGLASGVVLICLVCVGGVSSVIGDFEMVKLCQLFGFAIFGFYVVNTITGRIFLGDCGSYFLGCLLAWVLVLMASRNPNASPVLALVIGFVPLFELIMSVFRRWRAGKAISVADDLHLHSLLYKFVRVQFPAAREITLHFIANIPLFVFTLIPSLVASYFYTSSTYLLMLLLIQVIVYTRLYGHLRQFLVSFGHN